MGKPVTWEKKDANKLPQQESKFNLFEDYIQEKLYCTICNLIISCNHVVNLLSTNLFHKRDIMSKIEQKEKKNVVLCHYGKNKKYKLQ